MHDVNVSIMIFSFSFLNSPPAAAAVTLTEVTSAREDFQINLKLVLDKEHVSLFLSLFFLCTLYQKAAFVLV